MREKREKLLEIKVDLNQTSAVVISYSYPAIGQIVEIKRFKGETVSPLFIGIIVPSIVKIYDGESLTPINDDENCPRKFVIEITNDKIKFHTYDVVGKFRAESPNGGWRDWSVHFISSRNYFPKEILMKSKGVISKNTNFTLTTFFENYNTYDQINIPVHNYPYIIPPSLSEKEKEYLKLKYKGEYLHTYLDTTERFWVGRIYPLVEIVKNKNIVNISVDIAITHDKNRPYAEYARVEGNYIIISGSNDYEYGRINKIKLIKLESYNWEGKQITFKGDWEVNYGNGKGKYVFMNNVEFTFQIETEDNLVLLKYNDIIFKRRLFIKNRVDKDNFEYSEYYFRFFKNKISKIIYHDDF